MDNVEKDQIDISNEIIGSCLTEYLTGLKETLQSRKYNLNKNGTKGKREIKRDNDVNELNAVIDKVNSLKVDEGIGVSYKWIGLDINTIYETFTSFMQENRVEHFDNLILESYFNMLSVWKCEFDKFSKEKRIEVKGDLNGYLWNERSWLWKVFFYNLSDKVFKGRNEIKTKKNEGRVKIDNSQGHYWIMCIFSTNKKYSILLDSKKISGAINKSLTKMVM